MKGSIGNSVYIAALHYVQAGGAFSVQPAVPLYRAANGFPSLVLAGLISPDNSEACGVPPASSQRHCGEHAPYLLLCL